MAVTRIKSNQITDGAVTNAKIADASIQGGKLANSFTYGSDFTVSGNLTVNGTTTTVDTVTTTIDDPILLLGSNQTGAASVDLGILGERGDDTNVFMGYDESADEFVMVQTSTADSNSAVTITDYVTTHMGGLTVDDNATVGGTMTATGNVTGGNLTTAGDVTTATVTASGNITGGNLVTGGDAVVTGDGTFTGNVAGNNITWSTRLSNDNTSADFRLAGTSGTVYADNSGLKVMSSDETTSRIELETSNGQIDSISSSGNVTIASGAVTAAGNITGGNLVTSGKFDNGTLDITGGNISTGSTTTLQSNGGMSDSKVSAGTNVITLQVDGGDIEFRDGAISGAGVNYLTIGKGTGNVVELDTTSDGGIELNTYLTATGNVTGGNLITSALVSAATVTASGNVTGGNLVTAGDVTTATVTASGGATFGSNVTTSGSFATGNVTMADSSLSLNGTSTLTVGGAATFYDNIDASSGTVTGGNLATAGTMTATGNVTGGNLITSALVSGGTVNSSGTMTATGNVTGGNLITSAAVESATVTATGNITGGNIITTGLTSTGDLTVLASGTVEFNQNVLGNIGTPVNSSDATTKGYVDNLLSSGFTIADSANNQQTIAQGDTMTLNGTANEVEVTVGATDTITIGLPDDVEVTGDLTVGGNLTVQGSQTIVDATSTSIVDPILQLGRGANNAALTSNDGNDRGVAMYYYSGSEKVAFFGWDDPSSEFRFIPDATISSEEVTGSLGTANLGKVRVDAIDIDSNSITTTSGNLELSAAGASHVKVPTGNELVIEDIANTYVVYSNNGELEGGTGLTYNGTELYADNGNIGGYMTVTGQVSSATVTTTGNISAGGNLIATEYLYAADGNISGTFAVIGDTNLYANASVGGTLGVTGALTASSTVTATGNVTGGNLVTSGKFDNGTLEISGGNISTGNTTKIQSNGGMGDSQLVATNNAIYLQNDGGDVEFRSGAISGAGTKYLAIGKGTGNIVEFDTLSDGGIELNTYLTATGNITGGNLTTAGLTSTATLSTTGEATLASATVSDLTSGRVVLAGTSGAIEDSTNLTFDGSTLAVTGAITASTTVTATGNITGGNLITGGDAVVTGDITATGNVAGNLITFGAAGISNDNTGGAVVLGRSSNSDSARLEPNFLRVASSNSGNSVTIRGTDGNIFSWSSSGNVTIVSGAVTADGTVTGGTLTDGTMSVSSGAVTGVTSLAVDNITVNGTDITTSASELTINDAGADVDFRVEGSSNANLVYVDAGINSVGFGGVPTNANCTVCIESTDAIRLPVGTTAQRPTGAAGMVRYNSSTDQVEYYDVTEATFKPMGVPAFTVIASETFSGDGSTTGFTLGSDQTTQSCIISINGVVQLPTTAYAVSGNALTFTEAPESGDTIEVRQITTTTTVASLSNGDQSVTIECGDSQVDITGDVVVTGNLTFSGQNFLGQYNHSNVYVASSSDETNNTGSTLAITAGTLGFNLTQASYYQVFLNRQLLRPDEITVNLTNGTITFASDTLAANDEIEAVFLAT